MPPGIATVACLVAIVGLFALDRDENARTSKALWLPVLWVSLAGGSRIVSLWLGLESPIKSAEQYLDGSPVERALYTALMAIGVIVLMGRGREVGEILRANGPTIVFFVYCVASVLWSDYPYVAFKRSTKAMGDLVMVLIVLTDPHRPAAVRRFLTRIGLVLVPVSILLIKYYPALGQSYSGMEGNVRYIGIATDKNSLGAICLVVGLGCVWRLAEGRKGTRKTGMLTAQGALLAMVLWLFWKVNSLTALACFSLAGGVIVVTSLPALRRRRALVHLPVAVALCFAGAALFLNVGAELVETMGREATVTGRTGRWEKLLAMTQNPLLGTGFESFWLGTRLEELAADYWWHPNEAHNGYLEVFLNLGWLGVALLGFVMVTGYRNVVSAFRRDPDLGGLKLGYFVAGTMYGFTEAAFRMLNPVWILFVLAVVAVPKANASPVRSATPSRFRHSMRERSPDHSPVRRKQDVSLG